MNERELEDEFMRFGRIRSLWVARKPPGQLGIVWSVQILSGVKGEALTWCAVDFNAGFGKY